MYNIHILNTGGTFNKIYDPISGKLIVPKNNDAVNTILDHYVKTNQQPTVEGLIYKDSLEITLNDRKSLIKQIMNSKAKKIIIIHGTDTIDKTASLIAKKIKNKKIVLIGAMQPFSIEPVEATANLCSAYGFLQNCKKNDIYIGMHGFIEKYTKIYKNRKLGVFKCQA